MKVLWVGDAVCSSGFARSTHAVCDYIHSRGCEVNILGINYRGDPHPYPYDIYTAFPGGDLFGMNRIVWMCDACSPDVIIIQQDPWHYPGYMHQLAKVPEYKKLPVIGFVAVDGLNCRGRDLNGLAMAIFWTQFGEEQARLGGYVGPSAVVPLGVNTTIYTPGDKREAREKLGLPARLRDAYIVGNINRNQIRKRLDLTVRYFARWWKELGSPRDVFLFLHVAPSGENAFDLKQLAAYYEMLPQMILAEPPIWCGVEEPRMCETYRAFDVQISTTQGEGDGLTTKEGMACCIPQIVPQWSALGEWAVGAAHLVPCTTVATTLIVNSIGGVADETLFVDALHRVHAIEEYRQTLARKGYDCMHQDKYRWETVGRDFFGHLESVMATPMEQTA